MTRRDDRAYREYVREEQRSQRGCIAGRMQLEFHHGLLAAIVPGSPFDLDRLRGGPPEHLRFVHLLDT